LTLQNRDNRPTTFNESVIQGLPLIWLGQMSGYSPIINKKWVENRLFVMAGAGRFEK
jgi:hypothetical protein